MGRFQWRPTSEEQLVTSEEKVLSNVKTPHKGFFVKIDENGNRLWTVQVDASDDARKRNLPLVMVHGFAAGSGIWIMNLDSLSSNRPVYSFDLLGFARSDRPRVANVPDEAEKSFIDSIEEWRKAVHLDKFILLGHSFGAYLSMAYAIKYPDQISHLILCDPWGFSRPVTPKPGFNAPANRRRPPRWLIETANFFFKSFSPLAALRAAGPYGPGLFQKMRPDLKAKFQEALGEEAANSVIEYIYHCNAQTPPTGELAFQSLSGRIGWALNPMIDRVTQLAPKINLSFIHGSNSWIDKEPAFAIKEMLTDRKVTIDIIEGAGHHIYADNVEEFNRLVNSICQSVDDSNQ